MGISGCMMLADVVFLAPSIDPRTVQHNSLQYDVVVARKLSIIFCCGPQQIANVSINMGTACDDTLMACLFLKLGFDLPMSGNFG